MKQNPSLSTINDLFCRVAAAANPRAVLWHDEFGLWQPISSDQIYQRVRALAQALLGWGAQKGDRIALIAENRWEWAVTDFATLAIGAVYVPIYPTLTGEQIAVLVADADCRIAIVSTRQQFDKLNAVRDLTRLKRILMMDSAVPPDGTVTFNEVLAGADDRGSERDPIFDALVRSGVRFQPRGRIDLFPASLSCHGAGIGLRDVLPWGAGSLLLALRQVAAGHA
jgi:long-chain acyl-CoA synthetase